MRGSEKGFSATRTRTTSERVLPPRSTGIRQTHRGAVTPREQLLGQCDHLGGAIVRSGRAGGATVRRYPRRPSSGEPSAGGLYRSRAARREGIGEAAALPRAAHEEQHDQPGEHDARDVDGQLEQRARRPPPVARPPTATAANPAAGTVVTEMNTPTRTPVPSPAISATMPATPASSATTSENGPTW